LVEAGGGNGTLLTTIVSIDPIDFYFDIDEKSYLRYAALVQQGRRRTVGGEGTEVRIRLPDEKTATHKGTLDFVDNRLDRSTGTLRVRARIGNQDSTLSPGQFGRAELISASAHPALLVPNIALVTQPTGKALDVVGSDNKVAEREVILGGLFGAWREIRAGLKSDDRILVAGFQQAQVGSVVTPHLVDADSSSFSEQGELE
jgi:RND family efflux transporter MFP subunit